MSAGRDVEAKILEWAVEDYTGLWELDWEAEAAPERSWSRQVLIDALLELARKGWIAFYQGINFSEEREVIPTQKLPVLLEDNRSWEPPTDVSPRHIRFGATDEGEREYYRQEAGKS